MWPTAETRSSGQGQSDHITEKHIYNHVLLGFTPCFLSFRELKKKAPQEQSQVSFPDKALGALCLFPSTGRTGILLLLPHNRGKDGFGFATGILMTS